MITLAILNLIVAFCAYRLTARVFGFAGKADSLIAWFLSYLAQIIAGELILGIAGRLTVTNLLILNTVVLGLVWSATRTRSDRFPVINAGRIWGLISSRPMLLLVSALLVGFALVKVSVNLVNPPFGWDSLNYHFTFPVEWLKSGTLSTPITVFDDPSPSYYPINGSLFFFWLMAPLRSVFLADLGQLPFFILGFLAVFSLGKKFELDDEYAFYAAALFTLIPNYFKQIEVAYVDVMVGALFLAALNFLVLCAREYSRKNAVMFGVAAGLLAGTKTVALPYAVTLILPFILLSFIRRRRAGTLLCAFVCIACWGGFSYLRNLFETGNPLYPMDWPVFGRHIFKGVMGRGVYGAHFIPSDYRLDKFLFHEGLGAQTILFVLPAVFAALPVALLKKRRKLGWMEGYCLLLPLILFLVFRFLIPLPNARYLYPMLGVGMLSGLYLCSLLRIPRRLLIVLVFVCAVSSVAHAAKHTVLIAGFVVSGSIGMVLFILKKRPVAGGTGLKLKFIHAVACCALIIIALIFIEKNYAAFEFDRYISSRSFSGFWPDATAAWNWLNAHTRGDTIAYAGRPVPFPLYGSGFKNNVCYVSVNAVDPAKLHYFPDGHYNWGTDFESLHINQRERGNYRENARYSLWLENLRRRKAGYLFVYSLHQTKSLLFPVEYIWAQVHQDAFKKVFSNESISIYKIVL